MNEIKYRIYGKENRIMYSWEEILNFDSLKDTLKNGSKEDNYYSSLLQYTGIKDKSGKEIYVGDIIKIDNDWEEVGFAAGFVGYVIYELGAFKLKEGEIYVPKYRLNGSFGKLATVIGNIYENPELIKN